MVGVNQVAILRLEDVTKRAIEPGRGGAGGGASLQAGFAGYQQYCTACHGADLKGALPGVASLVGVTDKMGEDAIKAVVTGGQGQMRPVSSITESELTNVIAYLASMSPSAGRGRAARGAAPATVYPEGPVVARGGAPQPPLPPRPTGPFYPGVGGNAGNTLYPPDVKNVPATRYMTDYGVLASFTKPPYTTLTAYDLNTGEIKWQVPNGDHPPTIQAGGPANTGGVGARHGIVVTKGGLVFLGGGDGKVRAYDEDTGQVLWSGSFAGTTSGVPVSFESKGRQYFVVIANRGGGGRGRGAPEIDPKTPTGAIAFALPDKK